MAHELRAIDVLVRRAYRISETVGDVSLPRRSEPAGARHEPPIGPLGSSLATILVDPVDVSSR